jgi:hypothetical protein
MGEKTSGQVAYEAYAEHTGWKSLATGDALPAWADLQPEIKEAWEKAGYAAWHHGEYSDLP